MLSISPKISNRARMSSLITSNSTSYWKSSLVYLNKKKEMKGIQDRKEEIYKTTLTTDNLTVGRKPQRIYQITLIHNEFS